MQTNNITIRRPLQAASGRASTAILTITEMFCFAIDHGPEATIVLLGGQTDSSITRAVEELQARQFKIIQIPPESLSMLAEISSAEIDTVKAAAAGPTTHTSCDSLSDDSLVERQTKINYEWIEDAVCGEMGCASPRVFAVLMQISFRRALLAQGSETLLPRCRDRFNRFYGNWRDTTKAEFGAPRPQHPDDKNVFGAPSGYLSFLKGYGCVIEHNSGNLTWDITRLTQTTEGIEHRLPPSCSLDDLLRQPTRKRLLDDVAPCDKATVDFLVQVMGKCDSMSADAVAGHLSNRPDLVEYMRCGAGLPAILAAHPAYFTQSSDGNWRLVTSNSQHQTPSRHVSSTPNSGWKHVPLDEFKIGLFKGPAHCLKQMKQKGLSLSQIFHRIQEGHPHGHWTVPKQSRSFVPKQAVVIGQLYRFFQVEMPMVRIDLEIAVRSNLMCRGGTKPYEWVALCSLEQQAIIVQIVKEHDKRESEPLKLSRLRTEFVKIAGVELDTQGTKLAEFVGMIPELTLMPENGLPNMLVTCTTRQPRVHCGAVNKDIALPSAEFVQAVKDALCSSDSSSIDLAYLKRLMRTLWEEINGSEGQLTNSKMNRFHPLGFIGFVNDHLVGTVLAQVEEDGSFGLTNPSRAATKPTGSTETCEVTVAATAALDSNCPPPWLNDVGPETNTESRSGMAPQGADAVRNPYSSVSEMSACSEVQCHS